MRISLKALKASADAIGAHVEDMGDGLLATAPRGSVFRANGGHVIVSAYDFDERPWPTRCPIVKGSRAAARSELAYGLSHGVQPCVDTDCDRCVHNL